ncbi:MAG: hypothetical protein H7A37_10685, partial [Chlamydiales bacterium]|nr:hypothetical protein [Chlamydiales bacterium]
YEQCYCGRIFTGRIGYDFTQWYNLGRTRNSTSSGIGQAITNSPTTTTIGLHGFSLGVGMEF